MAVQRTKFYPEAEKKPGFSISNVFILLIVAWTGFALFRSFQQSWSSTPETADFVFGNLVAFFFIWAIPTAILTLLAFATKPKRR